MSAVRIILEALMSAEEVRLRDLVAEYGLRPSTLRTRAKELRGYGCIEFSGGVLRRGRRFDECVNFFLASDTEGRVVYALLGDVHLGRRTSTFNVAVLEEMVRVYVTRLASLRNEGYRIVGLGLGDYVDGAGIYGRQAYEQELGVEAQVVEFQRLFHDWFALLDEFYGIVGNHGRMSEEEYGNVDYLALYAVAAPVLGRRAVISRRYVDTFTDSSGRRILLAHQKFRTHYGVPDYAIRRFVSQHVLRDRGIRLVCIGHLHILKFSDELGLPVVLNGTFLTDDELSRQMGLVGFPGQALVFFGEDGVRFEAVRFR